MTPNRPEHLAANQPASRTYGKPVEPELPPGVRRAPDPGLCAQLARTVRPCRHGEIPPGECVPFWRPPVERVRRHLSAERAARRPEAAEQANDQLFRRALGHDSEARLLEVMKTEIAAARRGPVEALRPRGARRPRDGNNRRGNHAESEQHTGNPAARQVRFADSAENNIGRCPDDDPVPLYNIVLGHEVVEKQGTSGFGAPGTPIVLAKGPFSTPEPIHRDQSPARQRSVVAYRGGRTRA